MLHVFPHWSWKGREGQFIPVICYTDCDSVELFLNGRSVGVRSYEFPRYGMQGHYGNYAVRGQVPRTTSDLHLAWDVPYEAGVLRAVGTKDGAVAMTTEIATTGDAAAIRLTADRTEMNADRMDVVHLTVEIVDAQGRMVPDAALEVLFEVQGEGRLIGVDNGDPRSHEGYKVNRRSAFHGMCLGVVQATAKEGVVRVTASAAGLAAGVVTVTSKG
jgi:beta-galactosidase